MYQVVIVDDEPLIVDGLKNAIDWEGYHFEIVYAVTDPMKALEYIKRNGVHLLITDISMPEITGIELIKAAKKANPLLSILVLSAYDNFEYVRAALRYGAENYLLKPLDPDELGESIRQIVRHMREREQLSDTYGLNMLTFRSNFTEHWVKNAFSGNELKTRASLLGINLDVDNYTVLIFSSIDQSPQKMSQFFDFLLSSLMGRFLGHFYFETPSRLVCIVSAVRPDIQSPSAFIIALSESTSLMQIPMFIASGNTVAHYTEVSDSYQNAYSLLFLNYTCYTYISSESLVVSQEILDVIHQSFRVMDLSSYLQSLEALFLAAEDIRTACSYAVVAASWFLLQLGKEINDVLDKFPHLVGILRTFPSHLSPMEDFRTYIVSLARECYLLTTNSHPSMYPCVDAVIKAIHEFSDKDISLKTLATKLNVSPSYLGNIFRQQTGSYFNDYLTEARLQFAADLIQHTDMKMKDIVEKVGFSSQTYFNRTFKRYYNLSPVAYRRKVKLDSLS